MAKRHRVPKSDSDLQTRLGIVVRTCRQHLGITQEELAWRADMHRTYIADIERGARNVTLRSIANIAKALDVSVGNLFTYACAADLSGAASRADHDATTAGEMLLVESNADHAETAVRTFKRAKLANPLKVVRDGEEGLEYLFGLGRFAKRGPARPPLILLDLNLPTMSGLEFLRRVKGDARTSSIPVIVLATSDSNHELAECGRLGAENYIVKPLGIEAFVRVTPRLNLHLLLAPTSNAASPAAG